ncbi:MAG: hypothetical protein GXP13_08555 [Gammaproteobacteria bacterium]|nr:hypothetical protein [Gammaproteobacteria bacterium]
MVRIPVYYDLNGTHQIAIFKETEDGSFRRTTEQPMRLLHDNITGISSVEGQLVSMQSDREERYWETPSVIIRNRASSYYHFLREQYKQRKIFVFSRPSLNTRITRFDCHELQLKSNVSMQVRSLLSKKLIESINLDMEHEMAIEQEITNSVA